MTAERLHVHTGSCSGAFSWRSAALATQISRTTESHPCSPTNNQGCGWRKRSNQADPPARTPPPPAASPHQPSEKTGRKPHSRKSPPQLHHPARLDSGYPAREGRKRRAATAASHRIKDRRQRAAPNGKRRDHRQKCLPCPPGPIDGPSTWGQSRRRRPNAFSPGPAGRPSTSKRWRSR